MIHAATSSGQASGGATAFILIVLAIWALSRLDGSSANRANRAKQAKRKREVDAIVRSRPEDADIFREVLNELDAEDPKKKRH